MQAADQEGWGRRVVAVRLAWDCGWDLSKTTEPETHQFVQGGRPSSSLTRLAGWSDDLSCAALGFATATTILYHIVDAALGRKGIVEGEAVRSELARCAVLCTVVRGFGLCTHIDGRDSRSASRCNHALPCVSACRLPAPAASQLCEHCGPVVVQGECRTKHAAPCRKLFIQGG